MTEPSSQPKLLAKDQLVEAALYLGAGALVCIPGAFATGFGIAGAIIMFVALLGCLLTFVVAVNGIRRRRWRRQNSPPVS
jgi:hypothetical protein